LEPMSDRRWIMSDLDGLPLSTLVNVARAQNRPVHPDADRLVALANEISEAEVQLGLPEMRATMKELTAIIKAGTDDNLRFRIEEKAELDVTVKAAEKELARNPAAISFKRAFIDNEAGVKDWLVRTAVDVLLPPDLHGVAATAEWSSSAFNPASR